MNILAERFKNDIVSLLSQQKRKHIARHMCSKPESRTLFYVFTQAFSRVGDLRILIFNKRVLLQKLRRVKL